MKAKKKIDISLLMPYFKRHRLKLLICVVMRIISVIAAIIIPSILGQATDIVVNNLDFNLLNQVCLGILILSLISNITTFLLYIILNRIFIDISKDLRQRILNKIHNLSMGYFDTKLRGEIISYIANDVITITDSSFILVDLFSIPFLLIGYIVMMIKTSLYLSIVIILSTPLVYLLIIIFTKLSRKYYDKRQQQLSDISGFCEEVYAGQEIIKTFNQTDKIKDRFHQTNYQLYKSSYLSRIMGIYSFVIQRIIAYIVRVLIIILGAYLYTKNLITIGGIQTIIQYEESFQNNFANLNNSINALQSANSALARLSSFFSEEEMAKESIKTIIKEIKGNISFQHLSFGYQTDKLVIDDFNLEVQAGQRVAIVGATGSGKSTLMKLLLRFYEITQGSIQIDGIDIKDINKDNLRDLISVVSQEPWLFKASVKENIAYGNLMASDQEIEEAAIQSQALHFIKSLENEFNYQINEDSTAISHGQRQLLTIARAFVKNSKILILDEATSSLDSRTELLVKKAMDKLMEGRTCFIVAHRLSTIKNADLIIVMQDGKIIEQGSHQELIANKGHYYNLYKV